MSTFMQSARGASAYTHADYHSFQPLDEAAFYGMDNGASPQHAWSAVIDELLRIRTLEDDWDGEGSEAPHPALVDGAITLAQWLQTRGAAVPDRVHAGVNATVYFEWHTPLGYREIEVVSPVEAECRWVRKGTNAAEVVFLSRRS